MVNGVGCCWVKGGFFARLIFYLTVEINTEQGVVIEIGCDLILMMHTTWNHISASDE